MLITVMSRSIRYSILIWSIVLIGVLSQYAFLLFLNFQDSVSGLLIRDSQERLSLKVVNNKTYAIITESEDVLHDLLRIRSGDFLVAQGVINNDTFLLKSIEMVGLRKLIGLWGTSDRIPKVFSFLDFNNLTIHNDSFFSQNPSQENRTFDYSVSPSFGESWTIFLSQDRANFSGTLVFHESQLKLNIVDKRTGNVVHKLKLKRLSP